MYSQRVLDNLFLIRRLMVLIGFFGPMGMHAIWRIYGFSRMVPTTIILLTKEFDKQIFQEVDW